MPLEDRWFWKHKPSRIVELVGVITLAEISVWTPEELVRVGWVDENPAIRRLYELTNAGVWVARTDSTGKVEESNSAGIETFARLGGEIAPTVGYVPSSTAAYLNAKKRLNSVTFVSNAGGTIDTDPALVPALSSYYGVCRVIAIKCDDATTPVLEVQEGSTEITKISPGVLVAEVSKAFDENYLWNGTDNTAITLDGSGCADLGNAKNYTLWYEYWYET